MTDAATPEDFAEILDLLRDARAAENTGERADELLLKAERMVRRAKRKTGVTVQPPPEPPPPPEEPRPKPKPPVAGAAPISRRDPVKPEQVDLELSRGKVKQLSTGAEFASLREAVMAIGPVAETLRVGVRGPGGYVQFGDKYGIHPGFALNIAFVGLTEDATIGPLHQRDDTFPVDTLELHSIGLVAKSDSFAFHQHGFIRRMVLNDWWIKPLVDNVISQASGWYCTEGWDLFICKGYQPKTAMFREHVVYPKGGGMMQFLDNDMRGFGRTFANHRPHQAGTDPYPFGATLPTLGPVLWDSNFSDSAGWDRDVMEGGAVMTCWLGLEHPVVFRKNRITNARMGGIMCARGAPNTNPYETSDGYSFRQIWLEDNEVHVNGKNGSDPRHAVNISDADQLIFSGPNKFRSAHRMDIQLNSAGYGGRPVGDIRVMGRESVPDFEQGGIWVESLSKSIPLTTEDFINEIE